MKSIHFKFVRQPYLDASLTQPVLVVAGLGTIYLAGLWLVGLDFGFAGDETNLIHWMTFGGIGHTIKQTGVLTGGRFLEGVYWALTYSLFGFNAEAQRLLSNVWQVGGALAVCTLIMFLTACQTRTLAISAALLFLIYPTNNLNSFYINSATYRLSLFTILLALNAYVLWLGSQRTSKWLLGLALLLYWASLWIYEFTLSWFLVFPLVALIRTTLPTTQARWSLKLLGQDLGLFLVVAILFYFSRLKLMSFLGVTGNLRLLDFTLRGILTESWQTYRIALFEVWPFLIHEIGRVNLWWVGIPLVIVLSGFLVTLFVKIVPLASAQESPPALQSFQIYWRIALLGFALMGISMVPMLLSTYGPYLPIGLHARLMYPITVGAGLTWAGLIFSLLTAINLTSKARLVAILTLVGIMTGLSVTYMYKAQEDFKQGYTLNQQVLSAVFETIPGLHANTFTLLVMEGVPRQLGVAPTLVGGSEFSRALQLHYHDTSLQGDMVFDDSLVGEPTSRYTDPFTQRDPTSVILFESAVMLPRNRQPVDYSRVVIVWYREGKATIVNQLSSDDLAFPYNVSFEDRVVVKTNWQNLRLSAK